MKANKDPRLNPYPIRFNAEDRESIREIADGLGLSSAEVVRMAVRYALPKFRSGNVSIKDLVAEEEAA